MGGCSGCAQRAHVCWNARSIRNLVFTVPGEKPFEPTLGSRVTQLLFENLDTLTQGFQKSDLIILAGRPSVGKTALSLTLALNIIQSSQLPLVFFSLEMSKEQIMYRILSAETNISQTKLKNGQLNQNDWIKLNKILNLLILKIKILEIFSSKSKIGFISDLLVRMFDDYLSYKPNFIS